MEPIDGDQCIDKVTGKTYIYNAGLWIISPDSLLNETIIKFEESELQRMEAQLKKERQAASLGIILVGIGLMVLAMSVFAAPIDTQIEACMLTLEQRSATAHKAHDIVYTKGYGTWQSKHKNKLTIPTKDSLWKMHEARQQADKCMKLMDIRDE
jgi:hypothetical protein